MRSLALAWLLALAGCGDTPTTNDAAIDAAIDAFASTCPSNVNGNTLYNPGQPGNVACAPRGSTCATIGELMQPVTCYCTCAGYWNCDDVAFLCDGGVPADSAAHD